MSGASQVGGAHARPDTSQWPGGGGVPLAADPTDWGRGGSPATNLTHHKIGATSRTAMSTSGSGTATFAGGPVLQPALMRGNWCSRLPPS